MVHAGRGHLSVQRGLSSSRPRCSLPPGPPPAVGSKGLYTACLVEGKTVGLKDGYRPMATSEEWQPPPGLVADTDELERQFWRQLTRQSAPTYAADNMGSLFDKDLKASLYWGAHAGAVREF